MSQEIKISLPDGNTKVLPLGSNGHDLAASIGSGLAKSAIAYMVEGKQFDLSDELDDGMKVSIITIQSDDGLEIMRHTLAAQVLAKAIKNLYPNAKLAIGPTIETGFYYDVLFEKPISSDDLENIEDVFSVKVRKLNLNAKLFQGLGNLLVYLRLTNFTKWHFGGYSYSSYFDPNWIPDGFIYKFSSLDTFLETAKTYLKK